MTSEQNLNLYNPAHWVDMNEFDRYKYLIENDTNIQELKQEISKILVDRNLSAVMNDTKWIELQKGINKLTFPPAYNQKLVHIDINKTFFDKFEKEPSYLGDWSNYWEEGMAVFFAIEWLEIRPLLAKHQGNLVAPKLFDETEELILLLNKLRIPFEQKGKSIFIYGYF